MGDAENHGPGAHATVGQGVCALIGIGGAGKTAIADRFLQVLPGVLPLDANTPKDQSLPTLHPVLRAVSQLGISAEPVRDSTHPVLAQWY